MEYRSIFVHVGQHYQSKTAEWKSEVYGAGLGYCVTNWNAPNSFSELQQISELLCNTQLMSKKFFPWFSFSNHCISTSFWGSPVFQCIPLSLLNTAESILIECYLKPGLYTGKTQLITDKALMCVNKKNVKKKTYAEVWGLTMVKQTHYYWCRAATLLIFTVRQLERYFYCIHYPKIPFWPQNTEEKNALLPWTAIVKVGCFPCYSLDDPHAKNMMFSSRWDCPD